jgi:flagellar basal-body rod protein FlgF
MIKGIYQSASAMIPRVRQQEVIANNLANASAPGFKRDQVFTKELTQAQTRQSNTKSDWQTPMIDQVYTDYDQGQFNKTDNPLDMALEGYGFFVVEGDDGSQLLTRAGNFLVSPEGFLINPEGHRVMSEAGPITVEGTSISISESGQVEVDGVESGSIRVVQVDDPAILEKAGYNEYMIPEGIELPVAVDFTIRQGYLESSNVDVIREMVDMIVSFRNYESDAQSLKSQDDSLEKLIRNVGSIR